MAKAGICAWRRFKNPVEEEQKGQRNLEQADGKLRHGILRHRASS
jgi:hypothetical protein